MLRALSRLSSRSLVASAVGAATLSAGSVAFTTGAAAGASQDTLKQQVGYKAIDDYVRSGMVVGLGTGSTAYFAVERLGQKLASKELTDIVAIPTSKRTAAQAESLGIPLVTLSTHPVLDVAIDGADEVDPGLNLVKGRGGALLREKMVEVCAKEFVVIVDDSKIVKHLGTTGALPVEITPFCWEHTLRRIEGVESLKGKGCKATLRMDGDKPYVTDNDNYIVNLFFSDPLPSAQDVVSDCENIVGVVEHGVFSNMATAVIVASPEGIRTIDKSPRANL